MSARKSRKTKHKQERNIKPSHAKKNSSKFKKTTSSQSTYQTSNHFQLSSTFAQSQKKINNQSFYKSNPAMVNKKINYTSAPSKVISWKQSVSQHSNSYTESLTIQFHECTPKINNLSFKGSDKQLWKEFSKSRHIFADTMRKLFRPYIEINSIIDIILQYNGPHLLPIRYSIDILPYLHKTVRSSTPRMDMWKTAIKDKSNSQCVLDFTPNTNSMVDEDIYDEWVAYVGDTFGLKKQFSEAAIFYIPENKSFMEVSSVHISGEAKAKQIFTKLYIAALNNFANCDEYAFRLHLYGIHYRYYLQKREYSPASWGSRSRCWDGEGMVLLSDGTQKLIKYLSVGDEVAVLKKLPNDVDTGGKTATVKVKIESVVNRKYEMVLVNDKLWITPYHAVLNKKGNEWKFPCQVGDIEQRFEGSIFNFILDGGHVLCVNGVWACTLGHDLRGDVIENPMWGSSHVMYDMWSKVDGYPNIVEYI